VISSLAFEMSANVVTIIRFGGIAKFVVDMASWCSFLPTT